MATLLTKYIHTISVVMAAILFRNATQLFLRLRRSKLEKKNICLLFWSA